MKLLGQASSSADQEMELERIKDAIHGTALVDAHAHNLVCIDSRIPLAQAFSEARDEALLSFASTTLCFKRSLRDLAALYGIDSSLENLEAHRRDSGLEALTHKCFQASRISVLLLDDGLAMDQMQPLDWHKQFVQSVHRVLRVETVAQDILREGLSSGAWTLDNFAQRFVSRLTSLSEQVVAFKSIAAYRSGLEINPNVSDQDAEQGLMEDLAKNPIRISNKALISFIFVRALEIACARDIPLQIHSGFGDTDLDLRLANPLHLREVLEDERFRKCRIVLLHASYPFAQEASFLANVYPQVYLDFGLAIPKLSIRGMENTLSQLLELAPIAKVMFSTDGVAFPETYYLGAKWTREVLAKVLYKAFADGDLSVEECISAAEGILQKNALSFYKLEEVSKNNNATPSAAALKKMIYSEATKESSSDARLVRLLWCDSSGQRRCRVVPIERFRNSVVKHGVGLVECAMAMPAGIDAPADGSGMTAVGEIRLMPDTRTLRRWCKGHEIVMTNMDVVPGTVWECCPRGALQRVLDLLEHEFKLEVRAGFENEFYLLKPSKEGSLSWSGLDSSKYCSAIAFDEASDLMDAIFTSLKSLDIDVEQMHAEAGHGQFELSLNHYPALTAADNVLLLRETVKSVASKHQMLATFLPKYFANDVGSGSHVHLSLCQGGVNKLTAEPNEASGTGMSSLGEEFLAGVLHHLPAILAFTAPHPNSYERLRPNTWSGAFQCWGPSNREAALRTLSPPDAAGNGVSNFELKAFDGMANPHLGLAAIVAAGIDGLRKHRVLPKGIDVNPATLPEGTVPRLPANVNESVEALQSDDALKSLLGESLVRAICAVRLMDAEVSKKASKPDQLLDELAYSF